MWCVNIHIYIYRVGMNYNLIQICCKLKLISSNLDLEKHWEREKGEIKKLTQDFQFFFSFPQPFLKSSPRDQKCSVPSAAF